MFKDTYFKYTILIHIEHLKFQICALLLLLDITFQQYLVIQHFIPILLNVPLLQNIQTIWHNHNKLTVFNNWYKLLLKLQVIA